MVDRAVREERSGWRDPELAAWHHQKGFVYSVADLNDLDLNDRHRKWGWDCPATDIDKLFLEFNNAWPVAFVDYKHRTNLHAIEPNRNAKPFLAVGRLPIPFYVTFYTKRPWSFRPIWMNELARELAPRHQFLTEVGFVEWLYCLRDRVAPASLLSELDNQPTWLSPPPLRKGQRRKQHSSIVPTLFNQTPVQQQDMWKVLV